MIRRVRSFGRLSSGERWLLLSAFFWLSVSKIGLALCSFPALQRMLSRCTRPRNNPNSKSQSARFANTPHPAYGHPLPSSDEGRGQGEGSRLARRIVPNIIGTLYNSASPAIESRTIWAVTTAARHFPAACTCLPQALAAQVMLGRRNLPAEVKIGVAKGELGKLEAHAWLECAGRIVLGGPDVSRYTLLKNSERTGRKAAVSGRLK